MTQQEHWLDIIDKDDWQKEQPLEKRIIFVGSHPSNDICLAGNRGAGVAPKHIQLIRNQNGYKLVNISNENVIVNTPEVKLIPSHGAMNIVDGYSIRLGEFTLALRIGRASRPSGDHRPVGLALANEPPASKKIDVQIVLPRTRLAPHKRLNGVIVVRNLGEASGVKIDLELRGLEPSCYHVDSGPLLSSGSEQRVHFYIQHLGHLPPAGPLTFEVEASAPKSYPLSLPVTASQTIEIVPFYSHTLTLRDPDASSTLEPISPLVWTEPAQPSPYPSLSSEPDLAKHPVIEQRLNTAVRVKAHRDMRLSPGAAEKYDSLIPNSPPVKPATVSGDSTPGLPPSGQPQPAEQVPRVESRSGPKVEIEPAASAIPTKPPAEPVKSLTPKAEPPAPAPPLPPKKNEVVQPAFKVKKVLDDNAALNPDRDKPEEGEWWPVADEKPAIEKPAVMKLQAKPKPSSSQPKSDSPSLVDDWTADDEE